MDLNICNKRYVYSKQITIFIKNMYAVTFIYKLLNLHL